MSPDVAAMVSGFLVMGGSFLWAFGWETKRLDELRRSMSGEE